MKHKLGLATTTALAASLTALAVVLGLVGGATHASAPTKPVGFAAITAADLNVEYAGAIRCTNGVWETIEDAGHAPVGITSVSATSTYVQVNHVHVDKVVLAQYTPDNDFPLNGIVVTGASGGLDFDRVYFMKNGALTSPATACAATAWGNVWVDGKGFVTTP